jgi:hypothetical protein
MNIPTQKQIDSAQQSQIWDFGNDIIYDLCSENPTHEFPEQVITKVLFIGRIYASAVERRRNKGIEINDNFYIRTVVPAFRKSGLDKRLKKIKSHKRVTPDAILNILETHYYLTSVLKRITDLEKRSFCSKYLHFHLPDLFYIYDSRAVKALRKFVSHVPAEYKSIVSHAKVDPEYAKFYCKCYTLNQEIQKHYATKLSVRQLDNLFLRIADYSIIN